MKGITCPNCEEYYEALGIKLEKFIPVKVNRFFTTYDQFNIPPFLGFNIK